MVNEWQKRRDVMLQELGDLPVVRPNGGWCMLLDNEQLGFDSPHEEFATVQTSTCSSIYTEL